MIKYSDVNHIEFKKAENEVRKKIKLLTWNGDYTCNQILNACINIIQELIAQDVSDGKVDDVALELAELEKWVESMIIQTESRDPHIRARMLRGT